MSAIEQLSVPPVQASIENPADWDVLADQIARGSGMPTVVTPEMIVGMIGSAVPLLFAADAAGNPNFLRGTFADPVVAQCLRNAGDLNGGQLSSVVIHLVGSRVVDGRPVVRAHLTIHTDGCPSTHSQFWDLQFGGQVTVGQPTCPNCGAPIGTGELLCGHCHADVRSVVDVPIVVGRLELY